MGPVIGTHAGSYSVYRALAVAAGALDPLRKPDLTNTAPTLRIGPHPQWSNPDKIVSLDQLMPTSMDYARRIADTAPMPSRMLKRFASETLMPPKMPLLWFACSFMPRVPSALGATGIPAVE